MNYALLTASMLSLLAFLLHTFQGDKEIQITQPTNTDEQFSDKREKWTMSRCGWHMVSVDLLLATLGLLLINFTDIFTNEKQLLLILASYFLAYAIVWLIGIFISQSFPKNYLKLGQWILLFVLSGLVYYASL